VVTKGVDKLKFVVRVLFCRPAMKVLITAPSLDESENVSGISTMITSIIENAGCEFKHFIAGRRDTDKIDLGWLMTQAKLPFAFRSAIARFKPDVVHINTAFEPRAIVRDLILAKAAGSRRPIVHVHGGRFVMQDFTNSTLAWMAEKLLRSAARVIVLSDTERDSLLNRNPDLKVTVLPNAVATAKFSSPERQPSERRIVYLGRIDPAKGIDDMREASRVLVEQGFKFSFACYGAGPEQERFPASMRQILGEYFYYGGVVSGDAKIKALTSADIFLMPSRFEGLPLALLEAMAAGCVPVVSDRGAIPSVVEDGRNGFLVEPGNLTQIVGRLKFLLSEGETGWNQLRDEARRTVRERFDIADYSERLRTIYREVSGRT
jgi:glycosyltransferase involved in cell wall biosynthesis